MKTNKLILAGHVLLLTTGSALCVAGTLLALEVRSAITSTTAHVNVVVDHANSTLSNVNYQVSHMGAQVDTTLSTTQGVLNSVTATMGAVDKVVDTANTTMAIVNRPCGEGQACGVLADVDKTLNTASRTMGQVEIAANHEDKRLGIVDTQEQTLFTDAHKTFQDADSLIASSYITDALHNVDTSTKSIADSTKQADAILVDGHEMADKYTHPSKKKLTFWTALEAGGDFVRHFLPPIF
jgi:hypothetical protein